MKIKVKFFALISEKIGAREINIEIKDGMTLEILWEELKNSYPVLKNINSSLLFSINHEYASLDSLLKEGDEIALIPPVSGGQEI
ncbi:MAG: molybdopterin converting factor subunit 1 [Candidatus Schekmanbacteria bacterium RBG_16_38_10]|uniref:Molybdopterin synthase sulfur carrier subunit n=1 Tax=Candidatus Schekmanbacteria bacterium RBG_16_38_10 TaxID=1817879 RepID=A0A1F7RPL0_9BACT|nr:MAG: molybdopterin converting factor subunit 1 [Candidatus Schekmanbacteria bacterium RBG_16_38_10]